MSRLSLTEYRLTGEADRSIDEQKVKEALDQIWSFVINSERVRGEAAAAGIDLEPIDLLMPMPFILRKAEGFSAVEAIVIGVAIKVAGELTMRGLDWLWVNHVGPMLSAKTGLHRSDDKVP